MKPSRFTDSPELFSHVSLLAHHYRRQTLRAVISLAAGLALLSAAPSLIAGPYSEALNDPLNPYDAPVPGFLGPHGIGKARLEMGFDENFDPIFENPDNYVNPLFFEWANNVVDYTRSDTSVSFNDPFYALGPVTGDNFDVVSLGDLSAAQITAGDSPGSITLEFTKPIQNFSGADFVIFENGLFAQTDQGGAGLGGIFAELAYVEVSANGTDFIPFPSTSLTPAPPGTYGSIDPTDTYQLAGKHINGNGDSWGTPFDLTTVGLAQITHIRLIDIPGDGSFLDQANGPIYDPWLTFGSGGFDLEAVGAISTSMTFAEWPQLETLDPSSRAPGDDPDLDGLPNLLEYAFARLPWLADTTGATSSGEITIGENSSEYEFRFIRDERLSDLTYEVQVSASLSGNNRTTIAHNTAGSPVTAANGHSPTIAETSAAQIAGIDVIREVNVTETVPNGGKRFYRVKVSRQTP